MKSQLAEDFLKDFEDQSDVDDVPENITEEIAERDYTIPDAIQTYLLARQRPKEALAALLENETFQEFVQYLKSGIERQNMIDPVPGLNTVQLVDKCNAGLAEIDQEILTAYKYTKDIYNKRFPELEAIVIPPLDYVQVVVRLKNDLDVTLINSLSDFLPNASVMAITIAASVTVGNSLASEELQRVTDVCDEIEEMVECRKIFLQYIEFHVSGMAPNLTALVGSAIAARLILHAGSLKQLADMPAQNILNIGGSSFSRSQSVFASNTHATALPVAAKRGGKGFGTIWNCDLVQMAPLALKNRALRLVAGKCGLAARADQYNPNASIDGLGRKLKEEIVSKLKKCQAPPPAQLPKLLPIPDENPKPRRGGKRARRAREKYGMSELQKQANRLRFGLEAEGDYGLDESQTSLGMINESSKIRANEAQRVRRPLQKIRKGMLMDLL